MNLIVNYYQSNMYSNQNLNRYSFKAIKPEKFANTQNHSDSRVVATVTTTNAISSAQGLNYIESHQLKNFKPYTSDVHFTSKFTKKSAKTSEEEIIKNKFKTGSKKDILKIIDEKGAEYITKIKADEYNNPSSFVHLAFEYNSADAIEGIIDKLGLDSLLTNEEYYNPIEVCCIYNKNPESVGMVLDKIIGTEEYEKRYIEPEENIRPIYTRDDEGEEILLYEERARVHRNLLEKPLALVFEFNENSDVVEYIHNKVKTNKKYSDDIKLELCEKFLFEHNKNPKVVERLIDTIGKDNVMKTRTDKDGKAQPSYLECAFTRNHSPEVVGMLIDKFGIDPLIKRNTLKGECSILDRYFNDAYNIKDKKDVTGKIVEKIGPISLFDGYTYPLKDNKFKWFHSLFGKIYSNEDLQ